MVRAFSATGNLGYGFPTTSLENALVEPPTFLGVDAGSTDPGPYYLGDGKAFVSRASCKRDTRLLLRAALQHSIPLVIGSAGGTGSNVGVDWLFEIIEEISREDDLHFRIAVIRAEPGRDKLGALLRQGSIHSLTGAPGLTPRRLEDAARIVAMMGPEPIQDALSRGADVVVAGRCSDAALFAAVPLSKGVPAAVAWHAGKIIECGAAIAIPKSSDCLIAHLETDHFVLECPNPEKRIRRENVAAHTMYENANAFLLHEPGGILDASSAVFEQIDDRRVKVYGATFERTQPYTVKLEGVQRAGYRCITIAGTRDPKLIAIIDEYLASIKVELDRKVSDIYEDEADYEVGFRTYGKSGVMSEREFKQELPYELGLVIDVVAPSQLMANDILALARTLAMHSHFPGRLCNAGNLAFPFSPSDVQTEPVYEFTVNHTVELEDPFELFPIEIRKL